MPQVLVAPRWIIHRADNNSCSNRITSGREPVETCEAIFKALDGRDVRLLGQHWKIEVYSVLELAGRRYVQVSLEGPRVFLLTLRLRQDTASRQVIPALLPWLARPTGSGEVLDIPADGSPATKAEPPRRNVIPWRD